MMSLVWAALLMSVSIIPLALIDSRDESFAMWFKRTGLPVFIFGTLIIWGVLATR